MHNNQRTLRCGMGKEKTVDWVCVSISGEPSRRTFVSSSSWVTAMEAGLRGLFPARAAAGSLRCWICDDHVLIRDALAARACLLVPVIGDGGEMDIFNAGLRQWSDADSSMHADNADSLLVRMGQMSGRLSQIDAPGSWNRIAEFMCGELQAVVPCQSVAFVRLVHPGASCAASRSQLLHELVEFVHRTSSVISVVFGGDGQRRPWDSLTASAALTPKHVALFPVQYVGSAFGVLVLRDSQRAAGFSEEDMKLAGYLAGAVGEKLNRISRP